jgi:hypothetical protein
MMIIQKFNVSFIYLKTIPTYGVVLFISIGLRSFHNQRRPASNEAVMRLLRLNLAMEEMLKSIGSQRKKLKI